MRGLVRTLAVLSAVLLAPVAAYAQASITGVVKDTSGAVLPGVSVEATSPALTEKVRSVVTDGTGQYRIVELPPGTYTVTFSLTGFNIVKRDGVVLTDLPDGELVAQAAGGTTAVILNPVGGAVIELCDGRRTLAEVAWFVSETMAVTDRVQVEADVMRLVDELVAAGVLETVE